MDDWSSLGGAVVAGPPASASTPAPSAQSSPAPAASGPAPDDWGSLGGGVVGGPARKPLDPATAYRTGRMSPQDARAYEQSVSSGKVLDNYAKGRIDSRTLVGGAAAQATTFADAVPFLRDAGDALHAATDWAAGAAQGRKNGYGDYWKAQRDYEAGQMQEAQHAAPLLTGTTKGLSYSAQALAALLTGGATEAPTLAEVVGKPVADAVESLAPAAAKKVAPVVGKTVAGAIAAAPKSIVPVATAATEGAGWSAASGASQPGTLQQRIQSAADAVPEGAALGLGAHGVASALPAAVGAVRRGAEIVGDAVSNSPWGAFLSKDAADLQAGRRLDQGAEDPAAARANLAANPDQIVPGSKGTTAQLGEDRGLAAMERQSAAQDPRFASRYEQQADARADQMMGVQRGGDPMAVANGVGDIFSQLENDTQSRLDRIRSAHEAHVQATAAQGDLDATYAQAKAHAARVAIGGDELPEAYGEHLRGAVDEAEQTRRAAEGKLWNAIDPNGDLTGNMQETSEAASRIQGQVSNTAKPMEGEEAAIFDAAKNMNPLSPASDLVDLRSRVSEEMRADLVRNGWKRSQAYRRLTQLRNAIESNLNGSIVDHVAQEDTAVANGEMKPEDTLRARIESLPDRLQRERDEWIATRKAGSGGAQSAAGNPAGGAAAGDGGVRAAGPPAAGLGNDPGAAGLSDDLGGGAGRPGQPIEPLEPAALAHLTQAADDVATYRKGSGPVGRLLTRIKELGGLKLRDADGDLTPAGAEVHALFKGKKGEGVPVGTFNESGLKPAQMQRALRDEGWFGHVSDAAGMSAADAANQRGENWNDFHELLRREAANETPVTHPESDAQQRLGIASALDQEMNLARVKPGDTQKQAAVSLAKFRAQQDLDQARHAMLWQRLRAEADRLSIPHGPDTQYQDLLHDVIERKVMRGEPLNPEQVTAFEAALDHGLRPNELERHADLTQGGAADQSASAGQPAAADGGGQAPGGPGAPGQAGQGAGAAGEGAGAAREPLIPTFDAAAKARLDAATAATKARHSLFGVRPISTILQTDGTKGAFRLPNGEVPGQFFKPGKRAFTDIQNLYAAVGQDTAVPVLSDYAAMDLRRVAEREDGTLDPAKYAAWVRRNQDALRALPEEVQQRFGLAADAGGDFDAAMKTATQNNKASAKQAQDAISDAVSARAQVLKDFQRGPIGKLLGAEDASTVSRRVGTLLSAPDGPASMRTLMDAAKKSGPDAVQGLRQAVADHMAQRLVGNDVGLSGVEGLKESAFLTYLRDNRTALGEVFSPAELSRLDQIGQDIQRSRISGAPGASSGPAQRTLFGMIRDAVPAGQVAAAGAGAVAGGPVGAMAGAVGARLISSMRRAGIERVDKLVSDALLDPSVARAMLAKVDAKATVSAAANAKAAQAVNDLSSALQSRALRMSLAAQQGRSGSTSQGPR